MTQERNLFTNSAVILANGDFPSHPIAMNQLENNKIRKHIYQIKLNMCK